MGSMPSGVGAIFAALPGNGKVAPLLKRTLLAFAAATAGTPDPLKEIAPIQLHFSAGRFATGCGVNDIASSTGAGLKSGDARRRKCVNGTASSPGCGLISDRLARNSGTCISTLRRKMDR